MPTAFEARSNSSWLVYTCMVATIAAFALPMYVVAHVAGIELMNDGENVLLETWPGYIGVLFVAACGAFTAVTELQSFRSQKIKPAKLLLLLSCAILIVALFAMNSAVTSRLVG